MFHSPWSCAGLVLISLRLLVATDPTPLLPPSLAGEAQAILALHDPAWVVAKATAIADASGERGKQLMAWLDATCFLSRTHAGINLDVPAVLAWRNPPAPLLARMAVADRKLFQSDFGKLPIFDQILVALRQAQGFTTLSQVTPSGVWEYQLLMQEKSACLARTQDECRLLAAMAQTKAATDTKVTFLIRKEALRVPFQVGLSGFGNLIPQIEAVHCELSEIDKTVCAIRLRNLLVPDTPLAAWFGQQRNSGSRLLGAARQDRELVSGYGQITWNGVMELLGRDLSSALLAAKPDLAANRLANLRAWFRHLDQMGAFAWSLSLDANRAPLVFQIVEQPAAVEFLNLKKDLDELVQSLGTSVSAFAPLLFSPPGEYRTIDAAISYRQPYLMPWSKPELTKITAALPDTLISVIAADPAQAEAAIRTIITALGGRRELSGEPAITGLRIQVSRILAALDPATPPPANDERMIVLEPKLIINRQQEPCLELQLPFESLQTLTRYALSRLPVGASKTQK